MTFFDIHSWKDLLFGPIYFIVLIWAAYKVSFKFEKDKYIRKLIFHSYWIKNVISTIFIFFFWYKYGSLIDLGGYYRTMKVIVSHINHNEYISIYDLYFNIEKFNYFSNMHLLPFGQDTTKTFPLLILPFYYLGFGSIFAIIYLINFLVFFSSLYFYKVLRTYSHDQKSIAVFALFYMPSIIIWASGIYKDTLAFIGLSFLVYALFSFFIQKKYNSKYLILMAVSSYIILVTKPHILIIYAFIGLWILRNYAKRLSLELRYGFYFVGLCIFLVGSQFAIQSIAQSQLDAAKFTDVKKVTAIVDGFNNYYSNPDVQGGSQYSIGTFEPTLQGLFRLMPAGFNVTFYRPYLWEFRSPVFVFNVLESFVLLCMSLYIIFKWRLRVFKEIFNNEFLTFCFLYTLVLGALIGIMSFNFGTLARYKTPVMPFFAFMIFILFAKVRNDVKQRRICKMAKINQSFETEIN